MEKFNFTLSLIVLGVVFSVSIIYAEMTKESSGNDITGKKVVFLTSTTHQGDFGGVADADIICNDLAATNAELAGRHFKAWISDSTYSPINCFTKHHNIPYVLSNGDQIAENWGQLTNTTLEHAINIDEKGMLINSYLDVWTNTTYSGTIYDKDNNCINFTWRDITTQNWAYIGDSSQRGKKRSIYKSSSCHKENRLYCVEQ
ncbi:MAG: hypothetical protein BA862_04800 [Desulfobulbaceae bacterium S3730MH12]|nr:MAG: hypothetical protein BA866_12965 [Desulfobulbaceae bacterium S5133MH15]OEU56517.1 MAG: hypothetical protein BA862_04800 [Desulfobulbaceae bacterium S3730MH12]OEU84452.1 MAG: hypothetical protein BA873_10930 [Desulfobulbaceae bacterium C00003063]